MIGSSIESNLVIQFPANLNNVSLFNVIISIRDKLDSTTKFEIKSIEVITDLNEINTLIYSIEQSNISMLNENLLFELLNTQNENNVGQVLTSLSQLFNQINNQQIENAIRSMLINKYLNKIFVFIKMEFLLQVFQSHQSTLFIDSRYIYYSLFLKKIFSYKSIQHFQMILQWLNTNLV
jgi:hypothetical protein